MSKDGITPEMIQAAQRKASVIQAIARHLNAKIEHGKTLPDMTDEIMGKLLSTRDAYLAKAQAQSDEFFVGLDVAGAMRKLGNKV